MADMKTTDPGSDLGIAHATQLQPIEDIAAKLDIPASAIFRYGPYKGKIGLDFAAESLIKSPRGKLILVTAISPTPAGEGKTTTTIGLGDALRLRGKRAAICLREPSLGPCFGSKGGATGGGHAQVAPMQEINLHFTGDLHAIGAAHNLLASMIDNHIYWGNTLNLDPRRISWRRVVDLNDRALRQIVVGLGGPANGYPRETGFDITAASEVMAIFCLARSLADLEQRLAWIVIGQDRDRRFVRAGELQAAGAMAALLKDALAPNLAQTLEGTPAFIHGGPFANIAHGCNSVLATGTALGLADYVVTEAGFGADLGAEKFLDIKMPQSRPDALRRRHRRDAAGVENAWRGGAEGDRPGERRSGPGRNLEPGPACREYAQIRPAGRGRRQSFHRRHAGGAGGGDRDLRAHRRPGGALQPLGGRRRRRSGAGGCRPRLGRNRYAIPAALPRRSAARR